MARTDRALAEDLILSCTGGRVTSATAQAAVRALCRRLGGVVVYVPSAKEGGKSAERLRGVVADAVGDGAAEEITGRIMRLYGNTQQYIPLERNAFRKTIALEIFTRLGDGGTTMTDLALEYGITFSHGYRLWREGREEKLRPQMPYQPFLGFGENNNDG